MCDTSIAGAIRVVHDLVRLSGTVYTSGIDFRPIRVALPLL